MRLYRMYTAQGKLPKSASGAEIQAGFAFANPCVPVQSWAALRQGCLFLLCTKMLSACQAMLPQDYVGSEELLFSNLPKVCMVSLRPCLFWGDSSYHSTGRKQNPHVLSQWGRAVAYTVSRSLKLTPRPVLNNTETLLR